MVGERQLRNGGSIWTLTYPNPNNIFNLSHAIVEIAGSITSEFIVVDLVVSDHHGNN